MDVRGIYNAVVVLADAGRLDLAQEFFDLADEQRVPVEIKGGTHLARLAADDAIEQANHMQDIEIQKLEAELAALKAAQTWQPIESAPKDGTRILTIDADFDSHEGADVARYTGAFGGAWLDNSKHIPKTIYPTHWMPLPTPPAIAKARDEP